MTHDAESVLVGKTHIDNEKVELLGQHGAVHLQRASRRGDVEPRLRQRRDNNLFAQLEVVLDDHHPGFD